jgi:UDP-N-acetyl-D-glucosamine dehydrogenase
VRSAQTHPATSNGATTSRRTAGKTVAVVGLGYVGLPTALSLHNGGLEVIGLDTDASRLERIRQATVDLSDAQLCELKDVLRSERFTLTTEAAALTSADTVIICVPTPIDEHLAPDLAALRAACSTVVAQARAGQTLILTSTTYVGSTRELLAEPLAARGLAPGRDVWVAFSPERIDPGQLGHTSTGVPRVLGGITASCAEHAAEALLATTPSVHRVSSPEAAELTKLHENIFRAVNLALVNEMAEVAGSLGLDALEVIDAAATKPYGFMRFTPGPGVGGHCIPCDPHYLLWQLRSMRREAPVIEQAMRSIAARPGYVVQRAREVLADMGVPILGARVVLVGVAYKPGVQDVRESPAVEIASELRRLGADVTYTDSEVPRMRLRDGAVLVSVDPDASVVDLAIVHTVHPQSSTAWLAEVPTVLDATYSLTDVPHAAAV